MSEEKKVSYELRRRSKHYIGLYQGKHCLAAICTKSAQGVLDAQFLLEACDGREELIEQRNALLEACKELYALADNGSASFDDPEPGSPYLKAQAAIEGSK